MKLKRCSVFILSVLMFFLFTNEIEVKAMNTRFSTKELSKKEKASFVSNIDILPINEEPKKHTINCIDVNSNRLIAIGQNTTDRKTICIYSNEGVFQYGYTFNCSGDFGVEWDEENLNIYFVRGDLIVSVTSNGDVVDVLEAQQTNENNLHIRKFIYSPKRKIGDTEYSIRNDMGILNWVASSYSQIVVKDKNGTESVIYDVTSKLLTKIILIIVAVIVVIAIFAWKLFRAFMKG